MELSTRFGRAVRAAVHNAAAACVHAEAARRGRGRRASKVGGLVRDFVNAQATATAAGGGRLRRY